MMPTYLRDHVKDVALMAGPMTGPKHLNPDVIEKTQDGIINSKVLRKQIKKFKIEQELALRRNRI